MAKLKKSYSLDVKACFKEFPSITNTQSNF